MTEKTVEEIPPRGETRQPGRPSRPEFSAEYGGSPVTDGELSSLASHIGSEKFKAAFRGIRKMRLAWLSREYLTQLVTDPSTRDFAIERRYELLDLAFHSRSWIYIDHVFRWLFENDRPEFDRMGQYLQFRSGGMSCLSGLGYKPISERESPLFLQDDRSLIDDIAWAQNQVSGERKTVAADVFCCRCSDVTPETMWTLIGAIPFDHFLTIDGYVSRGMSEIVEFSLKNWNCWCELDIVPMLIERCWKNRDVMAYAMYLFSEYGMPDYGIIPRDRSPRLNRSYRNPDSSGVDSIAWKAGSYVDSFCELLPDLPTEATEAALMEFERMELESPDWADERQAELCENHETIILSPRSRRNRSFRTVPRRRGDLRDFDREHGGMAALVL